MGDGEQAEANFPLEHGNLRRLVAPLLPAGRVDVDVVTRSVEEWGFVPAYGHDGRLTAPLIWNRASRVRRVLELLANGVPYPPPPSDAS